MKTMQQHRHREARVSPWLVRGPAATCMVAALILFASNLAVVQRQDADRAETDAHLLRVWTTNNRTCHSEWSFRADDNATHTCAHIEALGRGEPCDAFPIKTVTWVRGNPADCSVQLTAEGTVADAGPVFLMWCGIVFFVLSAAALALWERYLSAARSMRRRGPRAWGAPTALASSPPPPPPPHEEVDAHGDSCV